MKKKGERKLDISSVEQEKMVVKQMIVIVTEINPFC